MIAAKVTGHGLDAEFDSREWRDFVLERYVQASCGFGEASCPVVTEGPSEWQQKDEITLTFFVLLVLPVYSFLLVSCSRRPHIFTISAP